MNKIDELKVKIESLRKLWLSSKIGTDRKIIEIRAKLLKRQLSKLEPIPKLI